MRRRNTTSLMLLLFAATVMVGLGGCHATRQQQNIFVDPERGGPTSMPQQSQVFASQALQQLAAADPGAPGDPELPWYAWRRDVEPSVTVGVRSATYQRRTTYTVDRQRSHRGRVFDHYHKTSYEVEVTEGFQ